VGFLDSLLGRSRTPKPAKQDRLFAMSTAHVTLETAHGMTSSGKAGIVFQAEATADFARILADAEELLRATGSETGTDVKMEDDKYGYRWVVLSDPDVEDLVVGINAIKDALDVGGYGARLLAVVFRYKREGGQDAYFIYNVKRGLWYPFVPAGGEQQRDNEAELRLKAQLGGELPMEPELERWFPLWGAPL
jgi:PspAB-like protein